MHDPTEKSGPSGEKQNLTFTTDFPVSLQKEFDGTQEIPYAPDLRPSIKDLRQPAKSDTPRKATRRPNTGAKSPAVAVTEEVEAPAVREAQPGAAAVRKAEKTNTKPVRRDNKKQLRRAKGWVTLLLVLSILLFLAFAGVIGLEIWRRSQTEKPDDPVETSSEAVSDPASEESDITSGVSSEKPSTSGSENEPYLSSDVQLTVTQQEEAIPGKNGKPLFTTSISVPTLVYTQHPQIEAEMNRQLSAIFTGIAETASALAENYVENCIDKSVAGNFKCNCSLSSSRPDIVTVMVESFTYNGGATSLTTVDCYNFKIDDGRILELDEVVEDRTGLAECAIRLVDKSLVWEALYENYIREHICDAWYFSADGLVMIYQKYSIGPGASDSIEVVVQDDTLRKMLTNEFK